MLTLREIFDKVKSHLLAQGGRAMDGTSCVYRSSTGRKCAVGCLIADEAYDPRIEGAFMGHVWPENGRWYPFHNEGYLNRDERFAKALTESGIPATNEVKQMLARLQDMHDGKLNEAYDPRNWPEILDQIERSFFPQEVQP